MISHLNELLVESHHKTDKLDLFTANPFYHVEAMCFAFQHQAIQRL